MTKFNVEQIKSVDGELVVSFTVYEGPQAVKTKYRASILMKHIEKVE